MPGWTEALPEFDLPAAPQLVEELPSPAPGVVDAVCLSGPSGRFVVLCSRAPLVAAYEATLFELLAESRYPAARPKRSRADSFLARPPGGAVVSCYPRPPGEPLKTASLAQLLEVGRLLARLHQLGETHPAKVSGCTDPHVLLAKVPPGPLHDALFLVLDELLPPLPSGALHGGFGPSRALFMGERCSAILPSGAACFGPFLLDVADGAVQFLPGAPEPLAVIHTVLSGYQRSRKLLPEEGRALPQALRLAAAREAARRNCATPFETLAPFNDGDLRALAVR
jgi:Ser/Thr protein kinase RdoA (MazF antagonist)